MSSLIPESTNRASKSLILIAAFVIIIAGMKAAESIVIPFLLAAFISIISLPPFLWLERKGVPKSLSIIIVILVFLIFISSIGFLIGSSINSFTDRIPYYQSLIKTQIDNVTEILRTMGVSVSEVKIEEYFNPGSALTLVAGVLNELSNIFTNGFLIFLTVVFMMLEVSSLPSKINKIVSDPKESMKRVQSVTDNINKYITIKTWISLITGLLATILLYIIGVDYPILWGVLAFLLNYIPTIGSIIALIPPALLAFIQFGIGDSIIVVAGYLVINTIMGNILEPKFMGEGLGLSALVVFLSLIFWGWVLGPIGMLLSVPLTITIKIALDSSEETRWIAVLLGGSLSPD